MRTAVRRHYREEVNIEAARRRLLSENLQGRVSVRRWHGELLPFNDNLVDLLLVESADAVPQKEMLRVLVPGGAAYVRHAGRWGKLVKQPS